MTKFYTFTQNNSGGHFVFDKSRGLTHNVIIEAENKQGAIEKAESIGLYFDGCDKGIDCDCCGDRWSNYSPDEDDTPSIYGRPLGQRYEDRIHTKWMPNDMDSCVHYADGSKRWFDSEFVEIAAQAMLTERAKHVGGE